MDGWEIVDDTGQKWLRHQELSQHFGYARSDAILQIYNEHQKFFKEHIDTCTLDLRDRLGRTQKTRVFSLSGSLKICRFSNMPKADEVMQQLIDLAVKIAQNPELAQIIARWDKRDELLTNNLVALTGTVQTIQHDIAATNYGINENYLDIILCNMVSYI